MKHPPPPQALGPAVPRIADCMAHSTRYAFKGIARLARDAGLDRSTVSRIVNGRMKPTYLMVVRITEALERELGIRIDPRDLVAENGQYLTRFACDLCGCARGCLPESATDEFGCTKRAFDGIRPGQWVSSRHPRGYSTNEERKLHAD